MLLAYNHFLYLSNYREQKRIQESRPKFSSSQKEERPVFDERGKKSNSLPNAVLHRATSESSAKEVLYNAKTETFAGLRYELKGNLAKATRSYELAIELDPHCWEAHYHLGRLLLHKKKDIEKAEKHLKIAVSLKPEDEKSHHELGFVHLEKAIQQFRTAKRIKSRLISHKPTEKAFPESVEIAEYKEAFEGVKSWDSHTAAPPWSPFEGEHDHMPQSPISGHDRAQSCSFYSAALQCSPLGRGHRRLHQSASLGADGANTLDVRTEAFQIDQLEREEDRVHRSSFPAMMDVSVPRMRKSHLARIHNSASP